MPTYFVVADDEQVRTGPGGVLPPHREVLHVVEASSDPVERERQHQDLVEGCEENMSPLHLGEYTAEDKEAATAAAVKAFESVQRQPYTLERVVVPPLPADVKLPDGVDGTNAMVVEAAAVRSGDLVLARFDLAGTKLRLPRTAEYYDEVFAASVGTWCGECEECCDSMRPITDTIDPVTRYVVLAQDPCEIFYRREPVLIIPIPS
jgi:hypothetical protein